jgi:predicted NAD/FAD-dependent oxidoreductase
MILEGTSSGESGEKWIPRESISSLLKVCHTPLKVLYEARLEVVLTEDRG